MTREEQWARRVMREGERDRDYGMTRGAAHCDSCGRFKSRPSSVCSYCGNDPVSHHGDAREFDRAHGYSG